MKNNLIKKVTCAALAGAMVLGATACGRNGNSNGGGNGGGGNGGGSGIAATEISLLLFEGTGTRNGAIKWAQNAAKRFAESKKDEVYETGKKGVTVRVAANKLIPYDTLGSDGNDIYLDETRADMYRYSASNNLMQLDEVIDYIKNDQKLTIDADIEKRLLGYESEDGKRHYYGLPHYEWYNSLTYDVDYFDEQGFYFAKDGATKYKEFKSNLGFGSSKFVNPLDMQKSCGPDGVYGTHDDGLPSYLEEFAKLCEYIKSKGGSPFIIPGGGSVYSFHMIQAIWAALEGGDTMKSVTAEFSDKPVEVVKTDDKGEYLYKSEYFFGDNKIPMPETEKLVLNNGNGYKMYDMASRYYALAFMQLAYDNGWFHSESLDVSTGADAVQDTFIAPDGERAAMYIDGTYWYHEAQLSSLAPFQMWKDFNPDTPRRLSFMNLPSQLNGSVKEGEGKKNTILNVGSTIMFVNKQVEKNEGRKRAVLEFLKFLYTEKELATFTEYLGMEVPINYNYDVTKLDDNYYYTSLKEIKKASTVITTASENPVQYKNLPKFLLGFSGALNYFDVKGETHMEGYFAAYKNGITARTIFGGSRLSAAEWGNILTNAGVK